MENAATQSLSRNNDGAATITVLGIESTAHTFGVSVVSNKKPYILSDVRYRYIPKEGGILPREVASFFASVAAKAVKEALDNAGVSVREVDAFAVSLGPGLGPVLRVGATVARALSSKYRKPIIGVNHAVAHIEIARFLTGLVDPVVLYVSGGNTTVTSYLAGKYRVFGETIDIALGNLLDTFAREIGIAPPYIVNGKHAVDVCAENGRFIKTFPYVVKGQDVSFSGLLTAAIRYARKNPSRKKDACYSLREIAYSSITEVLERGLAHIGKKQVLITGGVAASELLNNKVALMAETHEAEFKPIPRKYAGDNGVMIALTGLLMYASGTGIVEPEKAIVRQRWRLDRVEIPWYPLTLGR